MAGKMYQRRGNSLVEITPSMMSGGVGERLIGSCILWCGTEVPSQCKAAVGNTYAVEDYPEAARILGTTFGGDGVETFGTPDLRSFAPEGTQWVVVLGRDYSSITRLYCGREGIYCGAEGLYCGKSIIE